MPLGANYAAYSIGRYEPKTLDHLAGMVGRPKVIALLKYLSNNRYAEISRIRNGQGRSGFGIVIHYGTMNCGTPYSMTTIQPFDTQEWIKLPYNKGFSSFTNSHMMLEVNEDKIDVRYIPEDEFTVYCREVMDQIAKNHPNRTILTTEKAIQAGADVLRMLDQKDGHPLEQIKEVMDWALQNDFWKNNIFSMSPMRGRSKNGLKKYENIANGYVGDHPEKSKESREFNEVTVQKVEL
jgi:hypothetical protein